MGGQYGSEGKGKFSAYLASEFGFSIRTGGPNAGHTIENKGRFLQVRMLPCAFINPNCKLAIGAGGVIDVSVLGNEIDEFRIAKDRLTIDPLAVIIQDGYFDREIELKNRIGSTGKGVGVAVAEKVLRSRGVLLARDIVDLSPFIGDVAGIACEKIIRKEKILLEGTQGFWLSLHHGEYPYVTSRDITAGSLCGEAGIGPKFVEEIILVIRTYPIRVAGNSGPLLNELSWSDVTIESHSPHAIIEHTTVTKNVRRVGRFNIDHVKRATKVNSATQIALSFVDYLDYENFGVSSYAKLTTKAKYFIESLERETGVPVTLLSTGPKTEDTIDLRKEKLG
jgi:adenylosuccinate synthase